MYRHLRSAWYSWLLMPPSVHRQAAIRLLNCATLRGYADAKSHTEGTIDSGHHSGTMEEVVQQINKAIGIERGYQNAPKSREYLLQYQPKLEDLQPRSMKDSHTTVLLPLGSNELIRERYVNHLGKVRLGRVMEELDMFAVWLCHRHLLLPALPKDVPLPYTFVTLLVDKVEFKQTSRLLAHKDIQLSGHISWVGRSSMEITIYLKQLHDQPLTITKAYFLMVSRNATNTGSAPINPLKPADALEQQHLNAAAERQKRRKDMQEKSIFAKPPNEFEQSIMYDIFKRTTPSYILDLNRRILPPKCRWMADSSETSMTYPFPENRNAQNTVFGGYIMRLAVEISFITASLYVEDRPVLRCISDISFLHPVNVHSFLKMTAYVVYTTQTYIQIMTVAQIWDRKSSQELTTNAFYLTYNTDKIVDEVLPRSYHEALWYIHGRRKCLTALDLVAKYPLGDKSRTDGSQ